jgi:hypothetical protein
VPLAGTAFKPCQFALPENSRRGSSIRANEFVKPAHFSGRRFVLIKKRKFALLELAKESVSIHGVGARGTGLEIESHFGFFDACRHCSAFFRHFRMASSSVVGLFARQISSGRDSNLE